MRDLKCQLSTGRSYYIQRYMQMYIYIYIYIYKHMMRVCTITLYRVIFVYINIACAPVPCR